MPMFPGCPLLHLRTLTSPKSMLANVTNETAAPALIAPPFRKAPSAGRGVLRPWIRAQAVNLARHTVALRDFVREEFGSGDEAPTAGHILAVNRMLKGLRANLKRSARESNHLAAAAMRDPSTPKLQTFVTHKHRSHSRVQGIEKIWDFYFELFGQRQSPFGLWLVGCDRVALDCYQDAYTGIGIAKTIPAPPPFSYMRTGFGPATFRRGISLRALGRRLNPFPLIQLPYHRMVNPWTLGAILHEVSHNLQSDLGLSKVVPARVFRRLAKEGLPESVARRWAKWNREIFADLAGLLQGGPCIVASLCDVIGRSPAVVYHFSPRGVHPTPYLRALMNCELMRRMGFDSEATKTSAAWRRVYPALPADFPAELARTASRAMALVVDEICYQPYPELGGKRLAEVFRFSRKDQTMIEEAAARLANGTDPGVVPERYLIGAARLAFDHRLAAPEIIKDNFYRELARR
jgi:hypothetical protein